MRITLGSLFDGSGGFPLAGCMCGIEPVWASEIEPYPIAVTRSRFPAMKHLGDISKVNGGAIEPVDIITFGSPCQDLSVAGLRRGLKHENIGDEETTRSGLFMEAIRIIKEMRCATNGKYPRFALWENVPGAFSSNNGEDFRIVLEELIKISETKATVPSAPKGGWPYADTYMGDGWSLAYRTFDAQYWGVPQRRRRIYLVTDFAGGCAPRILFEREGLRGYFAEGKSPWKGIATDVEGSVGTDGCTKNCLTPWDYQTRRVYDSKGIWPTLTAGAKTSGQNQQALLQSVKFPVIGFDGYNSALTEEKSSTLGANCGGSTGRCGVLQPISFANVSSTLRAGAGAPKHEADFVGRLVLQPMAFAQNQRNEVRDLKDKTGALAANHGMKQQTYIVEKLVLDDQGGAQINIRTDGKAPTLRAEMHGNIPRVMDVAAYSFDSLGSNSMKSKNPHSGCRQVDVAKTLDTTDPNPCKNQGGMAIVQPIVLFEPRSQDGVPRIHGGITPTLNTAQGGQRQPCVALPVYCIQGNCIDRSDNAGCNGKGWREGASFTLNTIDREAIAYAMTTGSFMQVNEETSPTLAARDYKGAPLVCFDDDAQVYRQSSYANYTQGMSGTLKASGGSYGGGSESLVVEHKINYIVRRLTPIECARLQGFADNWGVPDHKEMLDDNEYCFWLEVRNTHAAINGRKEKEYTKAQMLNWYNKLHSDSSEYKMWGNGVALPPTLYCMQGISEVLYKGAIFENKGKIQMLEENKKIILINEL